MLRDLTATGQLLVVYSGSKLKKVVSHPDKPFYIHYIDDAKSVSVGMLINTTFAAAPCSCCSLARLPRPRFTRVYSFAVLFPDSAWAGVGGGGRSGNVSPDMTNLTELPNDLLRPLISPTLVVGMRGIAEMVSE